jgi:hypothetical protein
MVELSGRDMEPGERTTLGSKYVLNFGDVRGEMLRDVEREESK